SPVSVLGQARAQEVDDCLGRHAGGAYIRTPVPVVDRLLIRQALNPELRDAAVANLVIWNLGVLREYQGIKAVSMQGSAYPGPASGSAAGHLGDDQVVAQVQVVGHVLAGGLHGVLRGVRPIAYTC